MSETRDQKVTLISLRPTPSFLARTLVLAARQCCRLGKAAGIVAVPTGVKGLAGARAAPGGTMWYLVPRTYALVGLASVASRLPHQLKRGAIESACSLVHPPVHHSASESAHAPPARMSPSTMLKRRCHEPRAGPRFSLWRWHAVKL